MSDLNSAGYLFANGPFPAINDWFMAKAQENWPLYHEGHLPDHFVNALQALRLQGVEV